MLPWLPENRKFKQVVFGGNGPGYQSGFTRPANKTATIVQYPKSGDDCDLLFVHLRALIFKQDDVKINPQRQKHAADRAIRLVDERADPSRLEVIDASAVAAWAARGKIKATFRIEPIPNEFSDNRASL
jgi:hypothetical protein